MTFRIYITDLNFINNLKNALYYLYPEQYDSYINKLSEYNEILIIDDKILEYNDTTFYCNIIDDVRFIDIVNKLKRCNENTFLIKIKSINEYESICSIDKKFEFKYPYYGDFSYLIINNEKHRIECNNIMFFHKYKTYDYLSYKRSIKLKQLL